MRPRQYSEIVCSSGFSVGCISLKINYLYFYQDFRTRKPCFLSRLFLRHHDNDDNQYYLCMNNKLTLKFLATLTLLLGVSMGAQAQLNLGKLKEKAREAGKKNVENVVTESKESMARAQLGEVQRWALDQLVDPSDAPDLVWPLVHRANRQQLPGGPWPNNYEAYFEPPYGEKTSLFQREPLENILALSTALDARHAYNKRILNTLKEGNLRLGDYFENTSKASAAKTQLEQQEEFYREFKQSANKAAGATFLYLSMEKDGQGGYRVLPGAVVLGSTGAPPVARTAEGKWVFMEPGSITSANKRTTYATPEEIEAAQKQITELSRLELILNETDPADLQAGWWQARAAQELVREAIANNSKDNISYRSMPSAGSLHTAQLRDAAIKAESFGSIKILDLVVTGNEWNYNRNALGNIIDRWVNVVYVVDTSVAKAMIKAAVSQDRVGNGWGPVRHYASTGFIGYVK